MAEFDQDAFDRMRGLFSQYGLAGMDGWLQDQLQSGASPDAIALALRDTPQFKQRFWVINYIQQQNLKNPNSPKHVPTAQEVLDYENTAISLMRTAGLPSGFYDTQEDLQSLMARGTSVMELQAKIDKGFSRAVNAPPEVKEAFAKFFLNGQAPTDWQGAIAAIFLDPEKAVPSIERMMRQAEIGGAAYRHGWRELTTDRAALLADQGKTGAEVEAGLQRIDSLAGLFNETISESENLTAEKEGFDIAFDLSAEATAKVNRRLDERQAQFGGGASGGASSGGSGRRNDQGGLSGLGTAQ